MSGAALDAALSSLRPVKLRIGNPIEAEYFGHSGILAFVLMQLLAVEPNRGSDSSSETCHS